MDYFFDMALAVLFSTLKQVVKNPNKKAALGKGLMKLRDALLAAYPVES
jgi:hypothetical protein